jgi:Dihaem cytochrome c
MNSPFGLMLTRTLQLTMLAAVMGCAASLVSNGSEERSKRVGSGKTINFVVDTSYSAECTACHVGFLPGFLPKRSWTKIMGDLENHFGENASLEDPALTEIKAYLVNNAADSDSASVRSKKIAKMIGSGDTPLRIIETPFWIKKHRGIKKYVWKRPKIPSKSSCDSCHRDANIGIYDEHDLHVPR